MKPIMGYKRSDGRYGIRNKILVIATVGCANETARRLAERIAGTVFIPAEKAVVKLRCSRNHQTNVDGICLKSQCLWGSLCRVRL